MLSEACLSKIDMKKILLCLCVCLLLSCKNRVSESSEDLSFFGCASSPELDIMVGSNGAIWIAESSSLVWEKVKTEGKNTLLDVVYSGLKQGTSSQDKHSQSLESLPESNAQSSKFYAVGHKGTVLASSDGVNWKMKNIPSEAHLFAVATRKKGQSQKIVAVGHKKAMYTSDDDGLTWQKKNEVANKRTSLYDVAFGNGVWLSVGDYGATLALNDETGNVSETAVQVGFAKALKGVAFAETLKRWVVVGHEGAIFVSDNAGISWQEVESGSKEDLLKIAFNGRRFVVAGTHGIILTSKDGKLWKKVQINNNGTFRGLASIGERWLFITIDGKKEIIDESKMD